MRFGLVWPDDHRGCGPAVRLAQRCCATPYVVTAPLGPRPPQSRPHFVRDSGGWARSRL